MSLVYNIHYETASIIFLTVIYTYLRLMYTADTDSSRRFRNLVLLLIFANLADVLTAVDISYAPILPHWINIASNSLYFFLTASLMFYYIKYIEGFLGKNRNKANDIVVNVFMCFHITILIVNFFSGWVFYFDENEVYTHGFMYFGVYGIILFFVIDGIYLGITNRKSLPPKQLFSILFFSFFEIAGIVVQAVFLPNYLIALFAASVSVVVIMFALETPDYKRLIMTMVELEESQRKLEEANVDAENARKEAENANKAKSAFLAAMSHEIRTPINGVIGMNSIIQKESNDPKILEYANNIENAGNGLLALVNDILDFSKIESGKMEVIPVEYELSNVLSSCYNMVFMRARDKGLELMFENNTTIPNKLYGDETKIRQIITNLLTNAIKYTEKGTVFLTADWEEGEYDNMTLIISVKDTGIGIKKEHIERLFDAFTRLDEERNRNIEGTGLGLRITKQYMDLMDGVIEVESEYGAGSEFTVRIPQIIVKDGIQLGEFANYVHIDTDEDLDKVNRFKCPNGRILVVDDVKMNLKVIEGLLKDTELTIDSVQSGDACIDMVRQHTYDVILLDHIMPEMDGIETLAKLKQMGKEFNPRTPVIMLTANAGEGAKEEYLKLGFTDYLAKPVREGALNEMLIKYLPENLVESEIDSSEKEIDRQIKENQADENKSEFAKQYDFLDIATGMSYCMDSEDFYKEVIGEFRSGSKYDELQSLFDNADWKNYEVVIHGVKSTAMTIGAVEVSNMAKELEMAAKEGNFEFIRSSHYPFMRRYGKLLDNLDEASM